MSEATGLVVAPKSATKNVKAAMAHVSRESYSEALASGTSAEYAKEMAGVFTWLKVNEEEYAGGKTIAGAYVHRASRDANGGKVDAKSVNELLGVSTSTRYGYIARLYFDFGFGPEDGTVWTQLVKAADSKPEFRKLLNADGTQAATLTEFIADKPAVTVGGSDDDSNSNGGDTSSRGPGTPGATDKLPVGWAKRVAAMEILIAGMVPTSAVEWADLHSLHSAVETVLDRSEHKAAGMERLAILAAKADTK